MRWYEKIIAAHTAVTDQVSHLERMESTRYFVWQEDGRNDLAADGAHVERAVTGVTDLFTHEEFDPWAQLLEESLDRLEVAWELQDVQYEEDTGIIHYTWAWQVLDGEASGTEKDPEEGESDGNH